MVSDLNFARSQKISIILVAEKKDIVIGFTWGHSIPFETFPFLEGKINPNSLYMDEIVVAPDFRRMKVGTDLCLCFMNVSDEYSVSEIVLRTDRRNSSSMGLFGSVGFNCLTSGNCVLTDPEYAERVYLSRPLKSCSR